MNEGKRKKRDIDQDQKKSVESNAQFKHNITMENMSAYLKKFLSDVYPGSKEKPTKLISMMTAPDPKEALENEAIMFEKEECDGTGSQDTYNALALRLDSNCPDPFQKRSDGTCLFLNEMRSTYDRANHFCKERGGASVHGLDTYKVQDLLNDIELVKVNQVTPFCIQILTGNGGTDDGTLSLSINEVQQFQPNTYFSSGTTVIDACFSNFESISISNPSNSAWHGKILVNYNGKNINNKLTCPKCTGKPFDKNVKKTIVVDGNHNGVDMAPTKCLRKHVCIIKLLGCDCSWTNDGKKCGKDDGTFCWNNCCSSLPAPTCSGYGYCTKDQNNCTKETCKRGATCFCDYGRKGEDCQEIDECPWMTPTTQNDVMQCRDGTFCNVKTDAAKFECCKSHNGRGKCPKNSPLMCANKKCDGQTDYCCHGSNHYKDCDGNGHGGPRLCTSASFQAGSKDSENEICYGATHQGMTGSGVREVEITTYSGTTELEKDISCCTKCNKRGDCEYWVRATDSNECWLKSNDGNEIQEVTSNTRQGGLKTKVLANFDKQCSSCGQCKYGIGDKIWSLGGGNHKIDECVEACQNRDECFFASFSSHGYCHMAKTCLETKGENWTRFKKLSNLDKCLKVTVIDTIHPSKGDTGEYFYFDFDDFADMVGFDSWSGHEFYVHQKGSQSWSGKIVVWFKTSPRPHGRRSVGHVDGQWAKGDIIELQVCRQDMVLWLNAEGKNMNEVIGSGIAASHMGENLQSRLEKPNQCLGLIIYKENSCYGQTARLTSMDCNKKASFMCSITTSEFHIHPSQKELPCVYQNVSTDDATRRKREAHKDKKIAGARSKPSQNVNKTRPSHLEILDISLDPEKDEERKNQIRNAFEEYKAKFGNLDYEKAYNEMFELLWYSQVPCNDVKGLTSEHKDELSFIKRCFWKEKQISCNAIFEMRPTDRGMCCSFNVNKAENVLKQSKYTDAIKRSQSNDLKNGFDDGSKPSWYIDKNEPIPKAGVENGLTLVFDEHSDRLSKGSIFDNFRGVPVFIGGKNDDPLLGLSAIKARPGHENSVVVKALRIQALEEIRSHSPKRRNCNFPDEGQLEMHIEYSQKACIFECEIEFAAKCLSTCNDIDAVCDCSNEKMINSIEFNHQNSCVPWYLPIKNSNFGGFCDPWATLKFRKILKEQIPENQCKHCLPDCSETTYNAWVGYADLHTCESTTIGSFLCGLVSKQMNPAPWLTDVQNEYLSENESIPWYLDTHSSKSIFSDLRSRNNEHRNSNGEIFVAKQIKNPTYNAFERDIGVVNVFFDKNTISKYERANRLSTFEFLVQIASTLGFYMGISVLSLVEIIYWFGFRLFEGMFRKSSKKIDCKET